jgi:1-deoxy-D-xylulose-5-phosphate synthase
VSEENTRQQAVGERLLDKIDGPQDLKALDDQELQRLAQEIRELIIDVIGEIGGHFGANLGACELAVALHSLLDSPRDKIVWDVGHQAYPHKVLTGRRDRLDTIRQYGGLAPFCSVFESEHDIMGAGHASTSIGYAAGLKEAMRKGIGPDGHVVAVIGDGALTGGVAYEALHNAGGLETPIVIVLNDNGMSISPNVGALASYFQRFRLNPTLYHAREGVEERLTRLPLGLGERLERLGPEIKSAIKAYAAPGLLFEELDLAYALVAEAHRDRRVIGITAAMAGGTGLDKLCKEVPEQYYDVGIAEQNAVLFAAGLSLQGAKPVCAIYSTFLQRGFDQLVHDVCLQSLNVVFAMDRAGLVGDDGPTHHGAFDISYFRPLPNVVVMAPRDEAMLVHMLRTALAHDDGPIALRYPRGAAEGVSVPGRPKEIPIGRGELLAEGERVALLGYGYGVQVALRAAGILGEHDLRVTVADGRFAKPLDTELVQRLAREHELVVTIEENVLPGGFGSAVLEHLEDAFADPRSRARVMRVGLPDRYVTHGKPALLREEVGFTGERVAERVLEALRVPANLRA